MIREANLLDLPKVFDISKELYDTAINHHSLYAWDDAKALSSLKAFIVNNESTILIDEQTEELKGFLIAELLTPSAGVNIIAFDVAFFVRPKYQGGLTAFRLIKKYEEWSKMKGATHVELGISSGVRQQQSLEMYSRLGYLPLAVTYVKEI